ncbi:MAG TPA: acyltransferase family protein [Stenotrophomonas sp.]|nr:acyltransferase family protein [Stenotrophomonas sp.]
MSLGTARTSTQAAGYLAHVDGLRALAVLAVLAYHLDPRWLPGGFTGVDVFFAISGFVVSASVDRLPLASTGGELLRFYARRMRRIAPALLACLLGTALATMLFIPESWLSETSTKTGRFAFIGFSNWVLAQTGSDYFSPRVDFNPYTHTWSLGVEEQFYLVFPLLFLAWRRGGRGRAWSTALFACATLGSLFYAIWQAALPGREVASFYMTTTRFWQLGLGVLLYQLLALRRAGAEPLFARGLAMPRIVRTVLLGVAALLLGWGLWTARAGRSPWPDGLAPVLGTLALVVLLHRHADGALGRLLSARPVVALGLRSYSLYLWHWPVLVLLRWTIGLEPWPHKVLAVGASLALAAASYRWIELPWRRGRALDARAGRVIGTGLVVLVLGAGVQSALAENLGRYLSLSTVTRHPLDWYAYAAGLPREFPHCRQATQTYTIAGTRARIFSRGECDLPPGNGRALFVLGDSHAIAYNELLRRQAVLAGGPVHLYSMGGCAVAPLAPGASHDPGCVAFLEAALADVATRARPGDALLLPGLRVARLVGEFEHHSLQDNLAALSGDAERASRDAQVLATVRQLAPLAAQGVRIVFEAPKPVLPAPPYRCADGFNRDNAVCSGGLWIDRATAEAYRAPALQALREIAARLPGASVWDPLPVLCTAQRCSAFRGGRPLYFDGDHLSGYGNRVLLPSLQAFLDMPPHPARAR